MVIDFHTHILPGIDDGSKNSDMSVEMLKMLSVQGVDAIIATPHFYYDEVSINDFLEARRLSLNNLINTIEKKNVKDRPKIIPGAEVKFFHGLDNVEDASKLCIGGTNYMLIEMPFRKWRAEDYDILARLNRHRDIIPVIAHIERYFAYNSLKEMMTNLVQIGALVQVNAEFFTSRLMRLRAKFMMKNGLIQFVGTDCHDMGRRKPDYKGAIEVIKRINNGRYLDDFEFWTETFMRLNPDCI